MGLAFTYISGQTPLDEDEKEGLLIPSIATRGELDEFEQLNIEQAIEWTLHRSFKIEYILTEEFVRSIHKRMFGNVWKWAGEFRKTNKNLGVDKWRISTELKCLLDDTKYWIDYNKDKPEVIAIMFKHRIVSIHCFSNGNGRHSRLMADILIEKIFKQAVFTWGARNSPNNADARIAYLTAIKAADAGNLDLLVAFARS